VITFRYYYQLDDDDDDDRLNPVNPLAALVASEVAAAFVHAR
jgi:hypothetical protein